MVINRYVSNHKGSIEHYRRFNEHSNALITRDLIGRNWEVLYTHSMDSV